MSGDWCGSHEVLRKSNSKPERSYCLCSMTRKSGSTPPSRHQGALGSCAKWTTYRQKRSGQGSHTSQELIGCGRVCPKSVRRFTSEVCPAVHLRSADMSSQPGRFRPVLGADPEAVGLGCCPGRAQVIGSFPAEEKEEPFPMWSLGNLSESTMQVISVEYHSPDTI